MLSFFNNLFVSAASRPQLEQATPVSAATSDTQQQSLPETSELTTSADKVSGGSVDTDATSFVSSKPSLVAALTVADLPDIKKPIASDKPTTNILAKPPGGQISPTDSGYGSHPEMCNNDKRTQVKRNKLRLVRKRFSEQCKKIWNNASNARHKIGHGDAIENDHEEEDYGATDEESKDEESGDEEEDDSAHPRCDFKTIEAIKDDKIVDLVLLRCKPTDKAVEARVVHRTKGAYNFAAIVKVSGNDASHDFVVRIPGHATPARWPPEDEYMMEREVQLITYIHDRTSAPVPEIVSYSTKHENPLGVPYVLMTALPGKSANSIWYDANDDDELTDDDDDEVAFRHADMPSTATEKKRITFLRSLARIMSEIQALSFDKGGMAIFADGAAPTFGPMYTWGPDSSNKARKHTAFRSTQEYFFLGMVRLLSRLTAESPPSEDGCQQFFHILMNQAVFKPAAPETFTIHHNDLDLQNILVDDDGNVTGIIDWDAAFIAPRCMAAGPLFL
jgi:aminoglycoside phosphotransferase (APT) family kinase protein